MAFRKSKDLRLAREKLMKLEDLDESTIEIPDKHLLGATCQIVRSKQNFNLIPQKEGVYWIWTNEPVNHSFNKGPYPDFFEGGRIIYNGSCGNLHLRSNLHLFAKKEELLRRDSAISMDIWDYREEKPQSHRKCVIGPNRKVPFVNGHLLKTEQQLFELNLSEEEKQFLKDFWKEGKTIYFRNGINITDPKHCNYEYRFYFYEVNNLWSGVIEKLWRKRHEICPQLCSYNSGR